MAARGPLAGKKTAGAAAPAPLPPSAGTERPAGPRGAGPAQKSEAPEAPSRPAHLERAERILEQVRLQIRPELREAQIDLRPRELGRVAIHLAVRDGRVRASLRAERAEALSVLEDHLPELRAMFESAGLEPLSLELGLGLSQRGERSGGEPKQGAGAPAVERSEGAGARAGSDTSTASLACALAERMGIDLFA
jgi:flagellar hook-length control protein FliK